MSKFGVGAGGNPRRMVDEQHVPETGTPEEDERLADSQRRIDEAKAIATDLAETTPDPLPDSAPPPEEGTPGS